MSILRVNQKIADRSNYDDVHTWTPDMKIYLESLVQHFGDDFKHDVEYQELLEKIDEFKNIFKKPEHIKVVEKMLQRTLVVGKNAVYLDPDLQVNIWSLWDIAVILSRKYGTRSELEETISEMDLHCPQGDSHRLLMFIFSQI